MMEFYVDPDTDQNQMDHFHLSLQRSRLVSDSDSTKVLKFHIRG